MKKEFESPINFRDNINVDVETVDVCPICNTGLPYNSDIHNFYTITKKPDYFGYSVYFCTSCKQIFLAKYKLKLIANGIYESNAPIIFPRTVFKTDVPEEVKKLSDRFYNIYIQASQADQEGLSEICGMGYRKALEILIKDYAKSIHPDETEAIEKASLSDCLKKYVEHEKIKSLAKASSWLGNDETHYLKRLSEYDLSDLKQLLNATIKYIDLELNCQKAESIITQ